MNTLFSEEVARGQANFEFNDVAYLACAQWSLTS